MFKMGLHCSFEHLKHKLWPKEGPEKVKNRPNLLGYRERTTYCWKALDESYNFSLDCISFGGLLTKLWGFKVVGVPNGVISGLPLGSLGKEKPFGCRLHGQQQGIYKGEGGGFP
jgi:hypothetical protein